MSASEALRLAQKSGIRLGIVDADLILDAEREPAPAVLEAIRRHKAEIVALLASDHDRWTTDDWTAFYQERAAIAEVDGGLTWAEAKAVAFGWCIAEWQNRNPAPSESGRCAFCGNPDAGCVSIVPFLAGDKHTWLHPGDCWWQWAEARRDEAVQALAAMGLSIPESAV